MPTSDKRYEVSLPIAVKAATPEKAIEAFIDQIVTHGLKPWSYTVAEQGGEARRVRLGEEGRDEPGDVPAAEPSE